MAYPEPKWAVYYGTHTLSDGTPETLSAAEVAALYGIEDEDYLEIALTDPSPFANGREEMEYYHLKPLSDASLYFNAIDRYNTTGEVYWDDDFDARRGGKWQERPGHEVFEDDI